MSERQSAASYARWRRFKTALGTVYAIITTDGAWVKIGFTTDLPKRRAALARSWYHKHPTTVAGIVLGTLADERAIHQALYQHCAYRTGNNGAPRELYPVHVLNHRAVRSLFGPIAPPANSAAA